MMLLDFLETILYFQQLFSCGDFLPFGPEWPRPCKIGLQFYLDFKLFPKITIFVQKSTITNPIKGKQKNVFRNMFLPPRILDDTREQDGENMPLTTPGKSLEMQLFFT